MASRECEGETELSSNRDYSMSLESSVSFWDALSFWLITAGVILTFVGAGASIIFRRYNHELVVLTEEHKRQEAQATNKAIADAGVRAAEANAHAKEAEARAAEANARAAEANQKAEEDRLARLKIEQRFADRTLTDEQIAAIADKLRPFVPQAYEITPYWDMKESVSITNRIYRALVLAGWTQNEPQKGRALLGGVVGVLVYIHPAAGSKTKDAANSLVSALNAENISSELKQENPTNNPPNDVLGINVGAKF
jgi:hypothetical protein